MRKKYVIYTSIVGNYDKLPVYEQVDSEFDYICFSNDYEDGSIIHHWKIKNINVKINNPLRLSRFPKMNPHLVLPEYDFSVWIDGNVAINSSSIYEDIKKHIGKGILWSTIIHPDRDCVFEEIKFCVIKGKGELIGLLSSGLFLRIHRFPRNSGLFENNLIIRKHNEPSVKEADKAWWKLYMKFSGRDQIILPYILLQKKIEITPFLSHSSNIAHDPRFVYYSHSQDMNKKSNLFYSCRKLILYTVALFKIF